MTETPAHARGDEAVPRAALGALAVAYLALALAYGAATPVFEAADEHTHYFVAQHIARTGSLPVQSTDDRGRLTGPWEQEGSQPPLYYVLVAPLAALAGTELEAADLQYNHQNTMGKPALRGNENRFVHAPDREGWPWHGYALAVHLARALSTLIGLVTVLAIFALARRVFVRRPWLALAAAAVVGLAPQFLHVSASVTNDGLVTMLASVALYLLARTMDGHTDSRTVGGLAAAAALAPLAKLSGLALAGFALATLVFLAWRRRDPRILVRTAGAVVAAVFVVSAWWYARNVQLYGSVTGLDVMLGEQLSRDAALSDWLRGLPAELVGVWLSYWGIFGWFTVMLPTWAYAALTTFAAVGAVGAAAACAHGARWVRWRRVAWLGLWALVVFASLLRWLMLTKGGTGRLLFPAAGAAAVVIVVGWRYLVPRASDRLLAACVAGGFAALSTYALLGVIRPAYAAPRAIAGTRVPSSATPAGVTFGECLRLVAEKHPARVMEGAAFPLTLYWRVDCPVRRDGFVAVRLDQAVASGRGAENAVALVPGEVQLAYPGLGNSPPWLLAASDNVYEDRRQVIAPALAGQQELADWREMVAPAGSGTTAHADASPPAPSDGEREGEREDNDGSRDAALPITARLSVHLYDQGEAESWPAYDGSGRPAADGFVSSIVVEPRRDRPSAAPTEERAPDAVFTNGMRLSVLRGRPVVANAVTPSLIAAAPGATIELPVLWSADSPPGTDLSAFVHLVDASGRVLAQGDAPPATHGTYPTGSWTAGDRVPAFLRLRLPADAPAGARYALRAGLYRRVDGSPRIGARKAGGDPWRDDAVDVAEVVVRP